MAGWLGLMFYLGPGWIGVLSTFLAHRLHGFQIIKRLLCGALACTAGASLEFLRLPVVIPESWDRMSYFTWQFSPELCSTGLLSAACCSKDCMYRSDTGNFAHNQS